MMAQGIADQNTPNNEFTALVFLIQQQIAAMATSAVVEVVRAPYDRSGNPITPGSTTVIGFVDVRPLVNQVDGSGKATPHGTVHRLSYHRNQGGNGAFISDPVVGDQGVMMASSRDSSVVKNTNAGGNPGSNRTYDWADGTYFGCTQGARAPGQSFAWLAQGFNITDAFGNTIQGTAAGVVVNGVTIPRGGTTFNLKTHTHNQPNDSHGDAEMPTLAPNNGS